MTRQIEREIQTRVIEWARLNKHPLSLLFHIPNGGSRNVIEASNLKRAGVMAGIPDLFLPVSRLGYHGLWVELKSPKGILSARQLQMMGDLREQGYKCIVARSANEAIEEISKYSQSSS